MGGTAGGASAFGPAKARGPPSMLSTRTSSALTTFGSHSGATPGDAISPPASIVSALPDGLFVEAPVELGAGYFAATGLGGIDFFLVDRLDTRRLVRGGDAGHFLVACTPLIPDPFRHQAGLLFCEDGVLNLGGAIGLAVRPVVQPAVLAAGLAGDGADSGAGEQPDMRLPGVFFATLTKSGGSCR